MIFQWTWIKVFLAAKYIQEIKYPLTKLNIKNEIGEIR